MCIRDSPWIAPLRPEVPRSMPSPSASAPGTGPLPTVCPDPNDLAALAAGGLLPEERAALEAHLLQCDACRGTAGALAREDPPWRAGDADGAGSGPGSGSPRWLRWTLAAAALVLATLATRPAWTPGGDEERPTAERLDEAATELAAARPDLFAGLTPLSGAELSETGAGAPRGFGAEPLLPAGTELEARPTFRWRPDPEVPAYRLSVLSVAGELLWSAEVNGGALEYPPGAEPLEDGGEFLWQLGRPGGEDAAPAGRAFRVATGAERGEFQAARAALDELAPEDLRDLLLAHYSLRRDLRAEALRAAQRAAEELGDDPLAAATLARAAGGLGMRPDELGVLPR